MNSTTRLARTRSLAQPRGAAVSTTETTPLRVALAGRLTALSAPGGGEVQMLAMLPELRRLGMDAALWQPWTDGFDGLDVLHLFGSAPEFVELAVAARRRGLRVALSPIAWFDLRSVWGEPRSPLARTAACARFLLRRTAPQWPTWRRRLYHAVDVLLPNSQAEAAQLQSQFGVPSARMQMAPNAASELFSAADPAPFADLVGGPGFALCAGRIEPRKNQLQLIRALHGSGARLVVIGDPLAAHADYFAACRSAADQHVRFLPRLEHHDSLLASAYAACGCLAQPSWFETPGLAALEAGLSGAPLVVSPFGCTREYFGDFAQYVHPGRPREIRAAVLTALQRPRCAALADRVRTNFTWPAAAQATARAYATLR